MRRYLQIFLAVLTSGLFIYLAQRGVSWGEVATELAHTNYFWLIPVVVVGLYSLLVRAQRWRLLLETATGEKFDLDPLFSATAIGFMANMVLPLRLGEIIKPYLASRTTAASVSTALATVILERILDLLILFIFAAWVASTTEIPESIETLIAIIGGLAAVGLGGVAVLHFARARLLPLLDRLWGLLPDGIGKRVIRLEHEFLDATATLAEPSCFLKAIAWSLYLWVVIALSFGFAFRAFDIDIAVLGGGVTVTTLVAIVVAFPSVPGYFGPFHAGCTLALQGLYAIPEARALSYAIIVHATQFLTQIGIGVVYLLREGLSLGELSRVSTDKAATRSSSVT
ncbi:MAG: lysylphosphatidylglycerol synthase transmembrane domain-containing protein [Deltaproteobacteria bacterium]